MSRCHLADYVKQLCQSACRTCSTIIFPHSTNQIIVFWRCRCRWSLLCLSSLLKFTSLHHLMFCLQSLDLTKLSAPVKQQDEWIKVSRKSSLDYFFVFWLFGLPPNDSFEKIFSWISRNVYVISLSGWLYKCFFFSFCMKTKKNGEKKIVKHFYMELRLYVSMKTFFNFCPSNRCLSHCQVTLKDVVKRLFLISSR